MFKVIFLISIGGALGAPSRYLITYLIKYLFPNTFPFGTLFVNILGSFFIGLITAMIKDQSILEDPAIKNFLIIGFLGSFTTFSAFSLETINFINNDKFFEMIMYVSLSLILNIIAVYLGINFFKLFL